MTNKEILDAMGSGKVLAINTQEAFLVDTNSWPTERVSVSVDWREAFDFIQGNLNVIAPLSQFRWGAKIGWRELVGTWGEKFDIFSLRQ